MVSRNLLNYKWSYEKGVITLLDKKKSISFDLPIAYIDSLLRAGIAFKNTHRIEQLQKQNTRLVKANERYKKLQDKITRKRQKELTKQGLVQGQLTIDGKEIK